jgi:putative hydrolase of the HAD superfamily
VEVFFFDVGGTLLEPTPSVGAIYESVGRRHGLTASRSRLDASFRRVFEEHVRRSGDSALAMGRDEPSTHAWWRALVVEILDDLGFEGDREACYQDFFRAFEEPSSWRVFDDVRPVLAALAEGGVRLGVISNWDYRLIPLLEALDLARWFDPIVVSCFEGVAKPSPELYRAALRQVGVSGPTARYVGDRSDLDLEPARSLGMDAYLIDRKDRYGAHPRAVSTLWDLVPPALRPPHR